MRVGIVGAGIAGLAAARELTKLGHSVSVFEKAAKVGGRIQTVELEGYVFDSGATSVAPRGRPIESQMLGELDQSDLVKVENPIFIHENLRVSAGDPAKNAAPRYTYRTGNARLPEMLASSLNVHLGHEVRQAKRMNDHFLLDDEPVDAVILTGPPPAFQALLDQLGEHRPLGHVDYRPCLSILLGFQQETPDVPYHALLDPEQRHPMVWLSLESAKSPDRAPSGCTAMVAQMSRQFSTTYFEAPDAQIVASVTGYLQRLYGNGFEKPAVSTIVRWKYSLPEMTAMFESVNHAASRVLIAGDAVAAGRVESAHEAGVRAATLLTKL